MEKLHDYEALGSPDDINCRDMDTGSVPVQGGTIKVECDSGEKIQDQLAQAKSDDIVQVSGTCKDGVR